jgi:hypothetical protein
MGSTSIAIMLVLPSLFADLAPRVGVALGFIIPQINLIERK